MKTFLVLWTLAATAFVNANEETYEYEYDQRNTYEDHVDAHHDDDPPMFTASAQYFSVEVKDDITFPCDAKNIENGMLIFRHLLPKGDHRTLYVGDMSLNAKGYTLVKSGNSFILSGVARRHAGKYECRIETIPVTKLTHTLDVQYPAKAIRVSPEVQRVRKGSSVTLECRGLGNPKAAISWSRKMGHLPSGEQAEEGSSLTFENIDRHVEGVYICTAANGIGNPSSTTMTVEVEYPPEIIAEQATLHTDEGDEAKLLCIVHGRPTPTVTWMRNGKPLSTDTHIQEHDGAHRHTLTISKVTMEDFGNYTCSASNTFGEEARTLKITGVPKSPTITSSPAGGERFSYTVTWETESYSPVIQYRLSYRKSQENQNNIFQKRVWIDRLYTPPTVPGALQIPKSSMGPIRSMSHTLRDLEPATDYEIFISTENKFGWSENSLIFHFHTRKEHAIGQSASGCHVNTPDAILMMTSLWAFSRLS
ncbi:lachesin-like [Macrobrachium rosenbergii]|uniref:lachesin-like n=1 Tax=Macrobrachium rosenbergii TaxID=79674 RepID=UPI0034D7B05C